MFLEYFLLALSLLAVALYFRRKRKSPLDFPGPKGLPFIGCYFQMRGRRPHDLFLEWSAKYGGVFTYSLFGDRYLVVSSPEALHEALVKRGKDFAGRPFQYRLDVVTDGTQDMIGTGNLALNKAMRQVCQNIVHFYGRGRGRVERILDAAVDNLVDNFQSNEGSPFDPWQDMHEATSLTIIMLLCGQRPEDPASLVETVMDYNHHLAELSNVGGLGNLLLDSIPAIRYLPWCPPWRDLMNYKRTQDALCDKIVWPVLEMCRSNGEPSLGKALLDSVGQPFAVDDTDPSNTDEAGHITMTLVKYAFVGMIGAGISSTSNTFYALLGIFQCHPEIQETMADEIAAVVGPGDRVTLDHKDGLHYTRAVIYELLRYVSTIPLGVPHMTRRDTELCGTAVPAGTHVCTNLWGSHHDSKLWDDPWAFKPDRFLTEDGEFVPADHPNRKRLLAFGAGARVCMGELLAINRLILFAANVVKHFQVMPGDVDTAISCDPREYKIGGFMEPQRFKMKAVPRSRSHSHSQ